MQPQSHQTMPGQHSAKAAMARSSEQPLSDGALLALLGGIYIGGLGAFVSAAYALSLVV